MNGINYPSSTPENHSYTISSYENVSFAPKVVSDSEYSVNTIEADTDGIGYHEFSVIASSHSMTLKLFGIWSPEVLTSADSVIF